VADFLGREFNSDAYIKSLQNKHKQVNKPKIDQQNL